MAEKTAGTATKPGMSGGTGAMRRFSNHIGPRKRSFHRMQVGSAVWLVFVALMMAMAITVPVIAGEKDVFTVTGIDVSVTDKDAATAKLKAITEAQVKAFRKLLQRIATPEAEKRLSRLSPRDIGRLMSSLSVEEERTGPRQYIGRLSIRFSPRKVRALLRRAGVGIITERAPRILIVPVWQTAEGPVLWQPNPWITAWRELDAEEALVPVVIPVGDETDRQTLTAEDALAGDSGKLQALKLRYDTDAVLVAVAGPRGENAVRAVMTGDSPVGRIAFDKTYIAETDGLEEAARMAARRFHEVMTWKWKKKVAARRQAEAKARAAQTRLQVIVPFNSLREWQQIRARLASIPGVTSVDVSTLSGTSAVVNLSASMSIDQLRAALQASRLHLGHSGGRWYMQAF